MFRERGVAKYILTGIALDGGVLLDTKATAVGDQRIVEEFSHKAKVSSIKKTFARVETVEFHIKAPETPSEKEFSPRFSLPQRQKKPLNTISARYVGIYRYAYSADYFEHCSNTGLGSIEGSSICMSGRSKCLTKRGPS